MSDKEITEFLNVSRASLYRWQKAFNKKGLEGLVSASKRPHKVRQMRITDALKFKWMVDLNL